MRSRTGTGESGRVLVDVSSLCRTEGAMSGLVRVERELAERAVANLGERAMFVFWDPSIDRYRRLRPRTLSRLLGTGLATVAPEPGDMAHRNDPVSRAAWVTGRHLAGVKNRPEGASWAGWLLLWARRPVLSLFTPPPDRGRAVKPPWKVLGSVVRLRPGDVVFYPASDWWAKDVDRWREELSRGPARSAVLFHDLIPVSHPDWFAPGEVEIFTRFWSGAFRTADLAICPGEVSRGHAVDFCREHGYELGRCEVVPLAADVAEPVVRYEALPAGLEPGHYVVCVSTIEPRKGHALLLDAWSSLVDSGRVSPGELKLVFVGRRGWMVDELMERVEAAEDDGWLVHLEGLDDREVDNLYRHCRFSVYPSSYEGFGLPVVESLAHGRPVLASDAPPVVGAADGFATHVEAGSVPAWTEALARWMEEPAALEAEVRRIERRPPWTWDDYAEACYRLVGSLA